LEKEYFNKRRLNEDGEAFEEFSNMKMGEGSSFAHFKHSSDLHLLHQPSPTIQDRKGLGVTL
jgi:hypothetical protein